MTHPTPMLPRGVFSAALTPLNADLSPDHATYLAHCRYLLNEGCAGIAMLGTTGEANSFSAKERMALLDAVVEGGIAPDKLLPGTGVTAFTETVELTKHAISAGVSTVVMLPPFYYKGVSDDGVFAAYSEVVQRVADARLRIVLYHIPMFSAVPITHNVITRLRAAYPGVFVGIKDSGGTLESMTGFANAFPEFAVLGGADPLLWPLMQAGGAGCITSTSNLVARELVFIFNHFNDPSRTAELEAAQAHIVATRNRATRFAQIPSLKALTAMRTGETGWRRMRPPLMSLNAEELAAL